MLLGAMITIYGLGWLCFTWWDGGLVRRTLIILCVIALALATLYAIDTGLIPIPHSSATKRG